jgi:hypothetical protein
MPSVLYHLEALLLAVSGVAKLDTMPQESVFVERLFALSRGQDKLSAGEKRDDQMLPMGSR